MEYFWELLRVYKLGELPFQSTPWHFKSLCLQKRRVFKCRHRQTIENEIWRAPAKKFETRIRIKNLLNPSLGVSKNTMDMRRFMHSLFEVGPFL